MIVVKLEKQVYLSKITRNPLEANSMSSRKPWSLQKTREGGEGARWGLGPEYTRPGNLCFLGVLSLVGRRRYRCIGVTWWTGIGARGEVSFKMGTCSDPEHTHPGIFILEESPPPPVTENERNGFSFSSEIH